MSKNHYKRCSRCKEVLHISNFSVNKLNADGHSYHCKECSKHWKQKVDAERPFNKMWRSMMERCVWGENYNSDFCQEQWMRYGGRGIKVSEELQDYETFENLAMDLEDDFIKQYGSKVKPWLDRIDPDGHYERGNLRFVSEYESAMNKRQRNDPKYEHLGFNMPLTWWAKIYGLESGTLHRRVKSGTPLPQALNEPIDTRYSCHKEKVVVQTTDKVDLKKGVYYLNEKPITETDLCKHFNINISTFRARIKKYGKYAKDWSLIDALTTKA